MHASQEQTDDSLLGVPMPYLYGALVSVLVLAGTWFLFLQPSVGGPTISAVEKQCNDLCNLAKNSTQDVKDSYKLQYCIEAYDIGGEVSTMENEGQSFCSDGVHCFNTHTCETEETTLDAEGCREFVYNYYQEYNNEASNIAAQHVVDIYAPSNEETGIGSCDLSADWYANNFASTQVVQNE